MRFKSKIRFSDKKCFDGEEANWRLSDEYVQLYIPKGKSFRLFGRFFYLYREKYFFFFRFFDGYGLSGKCLKRRWIILFSERNGYRNPFKLFGWKWEVLRPSKIN